jgi:glucosamine--fructose-6-phosphate aminotransferase (isomerizing)
MCGIVGYIGTEQAYPILIGGLHRLEYRGYDSAGIAMIANDGKLNIYKAKGKVSELENQSEDKDRSGTIGIAHTRWATHGGPTTANAHPHVSESGNLTLVHNGIIENYAVLRNQLMERGMHFQSETDTEVLVQFIEYVQQSLGVNLEVAVQTVLKRVIGAYAIVVLDRSNPDCLVAARKSSPLVVGIGDDRQEYFIASDASPIVEYTTRMVYLNDEEVVVCRRGEDLRVHTLTGEDVPVEVKNVKLDLAMLDKGGFPHFMLKEIFDQPNVLKDCMRGRLLPEHRRVVLSAVTEHHERLIQARRFIIVSCGTSWHAGLIGKQLIEHFCKIPVDVEYASEFRYRDPVIYPDDVVIAISQSGETADTLAAVSLAKEAGAFVFGVVNAVGSSIARNTDTGTYTHVGPEIGVASTKAFTGQVCVLTMLALAIGDAKGSISHEEYQKVIDELQVIPDKIARILAQNSQIETLSKIFTYAHNFLYLGRKWNFPVALEGALKLKEISYIHAEGYPAAEMKHGPIALIDKEMPVVFIATHHQLLEKIISNMQEVKSRNGRIIAIITEGDEVVKKIVSEYIEVPDTIACLAPLLSVIPLQLLAYHIAVQKGLDVDQPRNLAKSVTVE